jgi:hypothetical protein
MESRLRSQINLQENRPAPPKSAKIEYFKSPEIDSPSTRYACFTAD